MKQPNDMKTIELPIEEKRGRGRPRLENAMTGAKRARLFRLNRKLHPVSAMPSNTSMLLSEIDVLRLQLVERDREIVSVCNQNALLIDERT